MDYDDDIEIGFRDNGGETLMLNKRERKLVTLLLDKLLKSKAGRIYISEKIGTEYLEVGERLFRELGGD